MDTEQLPIAARADEWGARAIRVNYRLAVLVLATTLASLVFGRGYGLERPTAAGASPLRRAEGEWVSVPWHYVGARSASELQIAVDSSACARVVRHEVVETPDTVRITVWRRRTHPSCAQLSVLVRLKAPLAARDVRDGGLLTY